jgi:hypothetical protein
VRNNPCLASPEEEQIAKEMALNLLRAAEEVDLPPFVVTWEKKNGHAVRERVLQIVRERANSLLH